jgi:hypothetical protein
VTRRTADALFLLCAALVFIPFVLCPPAYEAYKAFNAAHPFLMSFLKFALLATSGEALGLRLRIGAYLQPGFGLTARAVYWGLFGLAIQAAFITFSAGAPLVLAKLGLSGAPAAFAGPGLGGLRVFTAFFVSLCMNLIFAPVLMVAHKVTDTHITQNGGSAACLLRPIPAGRILRELDWGVMGGFVFAKTIPFFWIPAHTVTFLLPPDQRALFAALLGVALGVLLSVAGTMAKRA